MRLITTSDRFAIFGARGMAGSAISRALDRAGYQQRNPVAKARSPRSRSCAAMVQRAIFGCRVAAANWRDSLTTFIRRLPWRTLRSRPVIETAGDQGCGVCCFSAGCIYRSLLSSRLRRSTHRTRAHE